MCQHQCNKQTGLILQWSISLPSVQSLLALNPRVKTHTEVMSTASRKKEKKHWKRNPEKQCDVRCKQIHGSIVSPTSAYLCIPLCHVSFKSLCFYSPRSSVLCEVGEQLWRYQAHNVERARRSARSSEVRTKCFPPHTRSHLRLMVLHEDEPGPQQTYSTPLMSLHLQEKKVISFYL